MDLRVLCIAFFKGALMKDSKGVLIQQTENVQAARQMRFIDLKEITKLVQHRHARRTAGAAGRAVDLAGADHHRVGGGLHAVDALQRRAAIWQNEIWSQSRC